jgi:hypothetical protein
MIKETDVKNQTKGAIATIVVIVAMAMIVSSTIWFFYQCGLARDNLNLREENKQLKASIAAADPPALKLDMDEGYRLHSIDLELYESEVTIYVLGDYTLTRKTIPVSSLATVAPLVEEVKGLLK